MYVDSVFCTVKNEDLGVVLRMDRGGFSLLCEHLDGSEAKCLATVPGEQLGDPAAMRAFFLVFCDELNVPPTGDLEVSFLRLLAVMPRCRFGE